MGQATAIGDGNFTREVWMPPAIGFGDCGDVDAPDSSPGDKASSKAKSKDDSDDGDDGDDEDEDVVGDDGRVSVCHWAGDEARTLHVSPATSALHTTSHGSDYLGACTVADGGGSDGSDLSGEEAAFSVPVYLSIRVRATGTSTNASNTNLAADIVYEIAPDGTINQVAVRNWHRN